MFIISWMFWNYCRSSCTMILIKHLDLKSWKIFNVYLICLFILKWIFLIFNELSLECCLWKLFHGVFFCFFFCFLVLHYYDWSFWLIGWFVEWLVNFSSSYCFIFYLQICLIFFIHTNFLSLRKNFHILNLNTFWWIDVISRTILQNYVFLITINSIFVNISHHSISFKLKLK